MKLENPNHEKDKADILGMIAVEEANAQDLRNRLAELEVSAPHELAPEAPKFDVAKHPILSKTVEKAEPAKPVFFNTGDVCEALWTDNKWYKAKVLSVLGSASNPKYLVTFTGYDETLTVDRDSVRPFLNEGKKRKLDTEPVAPSATPAPQARSHVIVGAASVNPDAKRAADDLNKDKNGKATGPPRKYNLPNGNNLKKNQNSWQEFRAKGPGKKFAKKDSMFRVGDGVGAKVGFTGSGAGMTQDAKRIRVNVSERDEIPDQADTDGDKMREMMQRGRDGNSRERGSYRSRGDGPTESKHDDSYRTKRNDSYREEGRSGRGHHNHGRY
ncbi:uncharacterized protein BDR25DRAFT_231437 [Lindgomyces ingoldianus]|uniref:Uncharacterized protein n=1 Tax=Lindgomyces ingoldianus TaxID=673940 RepID=A0ACB6QNM6_9PLEO|nr:uncharacterized protein BDR25DRAFT_231437 [Lindgomyces ingoldianus]KAF2468480.1 hypothetical protein BDR25DRAFT_231437 [Lindgomyces ingoldianus]